MSGYDLVPCDVWEPRYAQINTWEAGLVEQGVTLVKVFLHISYEEQRTRLLARLDDPTKLWKVNPGDLEERQSWPAYQQAYSAALERCSTDVAPGTCCLPTARGTATGRSPACSWRRSPSSTHSGRRVLTSTSRACIRR